MKTISKQAKRAKTVANVLASLRIEHLAPSPAVTRSMEDCLIGNTSTDKLLADVQQRHVALRRV